MSTIGVKAIKYPDGDSAINITDGGNVTLAGTLGVTGETTLATHLNLGDNDRIKLGAGSDIQIYHDGTYSRIMETGGTALILDTTSANIRLTADNSENMAKFIKNGAVKLFYDFHVLDRLRILDYYLWLLYPDVFARLKQFR